MSIYYILTKEGEGYELDASTSISYTETGQATENLIEDGSSVTDHYINKPVIISFEGVITDVKSSNPNSRAKNTRSYIEGLTRLKKSKQPFSFIFGDKLGVTTNCVFEKLEITQSSSNGNSGTLDSFKVSATLKQLRLATRALLQPFRDPLVTDDYQAQTEGKGSTSGVGDDSESKQKILARALTGIRGNVKYAIDQGEGT